MITLVLVGAAVLSSPWFVVKWLSVIDRQPQPKDEF